MNRYCIRGRLAEISGFTLDFGFCVGTSCVCASSQSSKPSASTFSALEHEFQVFDAASLAPLWSGKGF